MWALDLILNPIQDQNNSSGINSLALHVINQKFYLQSITRTDL